MITIYTIAWNEQLMLPFFIDHYRRMFSDCRIVVYDNESDDETVNIAKMMDCEVITFKTGDTLSDRTYLEIKNNCWKTAKTDWVLIADVDEHLHISEQTLLNEQIAETTIITAHGFNMVNPHDDLNLGAINRGIRATSYDKLYCFDRTKIQEINYLYGCHKAHPKGEIKFSERAYTCKHYKYINIDYMIGRHATFAKRLSDHNKQHGYGGHYLYTPREIRKEFMKARKESHVI